MNHLFDSDIKEINYDFLTSIIDLTLHTPRFHLFLQSTHLLNTKVGHLLQYLIDSLFLFQRSCSQKSCINCSCSKMQYNILCMTLLGMTEPGYKSILYKLEWETLILLIILIQTCVICG